MKLNSPETKKLFKWSSDQKMKPSCVFVQAPQFVDIPLAEEDSSDEEYRPDEEEEDETAEDVRLCSHWPQCGVILTIDYWLSVCLDIPGEWHGEHSFVPQGKSTDQGRGRQLQPLAGMTVPSYRTQWQSPCPINIGKKLFTHWHTCDTVWKGFLQKTHRNLHKTLVG